MSLMLFFYVSIRGRLERSIDLIKHNSRCHNESRFAVDCGIGGEKGGGGGEAR